VDVQKPPFTLVGELQFYMTCLSAANIYCYNDKVKVNLSLSLTEHHAMKTYWGDGSITTRILNLVTRLDELSA